MFNTDLPSGRRRLFFLILLVFTVAGFSAKYLLIKLGWVNQTGARPDDLPSVPAAASPEQMAEPADIPGYSRQELREAEAFAGEYLRLYASVDPGRKEERLNRLRPLTSEGLFEILRKEAEQARPVDGPVTTSVKEISNRSCAQSGGAVSCLVQCVIEERGQSGNGILFERVYELRMTRSGADWRVEEVAVRGSLE